jgi:hypothetical protein
MYAGGAGAERKIDALDAHGGLIEAALGRGLVHAYGPGSA